LDFLSRAKSLTAKDKSRYPQCAGELLTELYATVAQTGVWESAEGLTIQPTRLLECQPSLSSTDERHMQMDVYAIAYWPVEKPPPAVESEKGGMDVRAPNHWVSKLCDFLHEGNSVGPAMLLHITLIGNAFAEDGSDKPVGS